MLATLDGVVVDGANARRAGGADPLDGHPAVAALAAGGMAPPAPDGIGRAELRELARRGVLVERDGLWFHADAVAAAGRVAAGLLGARPAGFTVGEFREAAGITRKHAVPLLAELDARGVTRRRDDLRIAGTRLPAGFSGVLVAPGASQAAQNPVRRIRGGGGARPGSGRPRCRSARRRRWRAGGTRSRTGQLAHTDLARRSRASRSCFRSVCIGG